MSKTTVRFTVSGQTKLMPVKMAELLVRIGKCQYVDEPAETPAVIAPEPPKPPAFVMAAPIEQPAPVEEPAPFFEQPAPVEMPAEPEPVMAVEFPPLEMESKDLEAEDSAVETEAEPKPKRRYRRRDMSAES